MEKEVFEIIRDIEDKDAFVDQRCFYHGFLYYSDSFKNMLLEGIKCKKLLDMPPVGYNGLYYISLTKYNKEDGSLYDYYSSRYPMFMISEDIGAFKTNIKYLNPLYVNSIVPLRGSPYVDEWQAFKLIKPSNFLGIEFSVSKGDLVKELKILKSMVLVLKECNLDYPVYDFNNLKEINKDKVLKLL